MRGAAKWAWWLGVTASAAYVVSYALAAFGMDVAALVVGLVGLAGVVMMLVAGVVFFTRSKGSGTV